jgi:hypothetical protein
VSVRCAVCRMAKARKLLLVLLASIVRRFCTHGKASSETHLTTSVNLANGTLSPLGGMWNITLRPRWQQLFFERDPRSRILRSGRHKALTQ